MRIKAEQLSSHVKRPLSPIYLVCGDEPLQVEETCTALRTGAREQDYAERITLHAGTGFDWNSLLQTSQTLSLFAQRRLIELRIPTGKPGDAGSAALTSYAARPAQDTVLLVTTPKLDAATQKSKWCVALEGAGVLIQIWPISPAQLPAWIAQRLRAKGMQVSNAAAALLAERVEGNLLAAAQDIEKLYLLYGATGIDVDRITAAVADSARFDVYELADAALQGDAVRAARILNGLRAEGVEPTLVLWALARELRSLASIAYDCRSGLGVEQALAKHKVWDKRKPMVKKALQRARLTHWQSLLRLAGRIDKVIKGIRAGNVWDELLQLSMAMAGVHLLEDEVLRA